MLSHIVQQLPHVEHTAPYDLDAAKPQLKATKIGRSGLLVLGKAYMLFTTT